LTGLSTQEFYYSSDGRNSVGPSSLNEVQDLFAGGYITPDSYICRIGDNAWKQVRDFPEIQSSDSGKQTTNFAGKQSNGNGNGNGNGHVREIVQPIAIQTAAEPHTNGASTVVAKITLTISVETSSSSPQIKVEVAK
jgi:hypothetical protein